MTSKFEIPEALAPFVARLQSEDAHRVEEAGCSLSLSCSCLGGVPSPPSSFRRVSRTDAEEFDDFDNGVLTVTRERFQDDESRAIVDIADHPLAGLFVTLRVFDDEGLFAIAAREPQDHRDE